MRDKVSHLIAHNLRLYFYQYNLFHLYFFIIPLFSEYSPDPRFSESTQNKLHR